MLKRWLLYLWFNQDGFFGIGEGPSGSEKGDANFLGGVANFGVGQGESDILKAQNFWSSILSGDPAKISQVLGPEMSAINKKGQQQKMTNAQFGNRSGGTNASNQTIGDRTSSGIQSLIGNLTGGAASSLGSLGSGLLNTGASASMSKFGEDQTIHDQQSAKWNDIFKSAVSVGAAPFTGGGSFSMLASPSGGGGGGGGTPWNFSMPNFGGGGSNGGYDPLSNPDLSMIPAGD